MAMKWTKDQRKVIDLRDRNILVSAAAGSGKTAVLVERIIGRIMDKKQPVDIDRMLIVTFTNAAAAEMRERIRQAIEDALEREPENVHLQKQESLVHHAQITTIHSFCLYLIRNYFHKIDLEPNFRIAEEGELNLLREDVLSELLNESYEKADADYLTFVETFATGKKDDVLHDLILRLYHFAMSYPWPKEWLTSLKEAYQADTQEALMSQRWMQRTMEYLKDLFQDLVRIAEENICLTECIDGPAFANKVALDDKMQIEDLLNYDTYEKIAKVISNINFVRMPSKRGFEGDEDKLSLFKENRDEIKEQLKKIKSQFFFAPLDVLISRIVQMQPAMNEFVYLTERFIDAYDAKKREKNVLDFSDLEHFALKILLDAETKEPTDVAVECQNLFEEVMVDEYQDSNLIQEELLRAASKERCGGHNRFMVGDVKQSIYRFRLARPELFMEKYDTYTKEDSVNQKIELHQNFRSRAEVLNCVNDIFYQIMQKDIGNVAYDEDAALYVGASFPDTQGMDAELLLCDSDDEMLEESEMNAVSLEAETVAVRIERLMKEQLVTDKATGELRKLRYSDIVILLRSFGKHAETFIEVFNRHGIPAHATSKTGYFQAKEIQTVLNLLRVLDNPRQDIPLASVLLNFGDFTKEELSILKACGEQRAFHLCVLEAKQENLSEELWQKVEKMKIFLNHFRDLLTELPVHELLYRILEETGYLQYVTAMPNGIQRKANIEMLIEKAVDYEKTSYRGLFHFIRYIDKLQRYEVDYAEAEVISENAEAVRLMTIHKSKGLEFPVVFLSAAGKKFNRQDSRSTMVMHPELGVAVDFIDPIRRIRGTSLYKKAVAKQLEIENLGEELRVLYVALTRAKEKLIITGARKGIEDELLKLNLKNEISEETPCMTYFDRICADCYLDWILPVFVKSKKYPMEIWNVEQLVTEEIKEQAESLFGLKELLDGIEKPQEWADEFVQKRLSYQYQYESETNRKVKYSVSELKHRAMERMSEEETSVTVRMFEPEEIVPYVPEFVSNTKTVNQGALRGSAMHRAVECLPIDRLVDSVNLKDDLNIEIESIVSDGYMTEELEELLRRDKLITFYRSDLAKRMKQAFCCGELYRERPFVMGCASSEIEKDDSDTMILVQGIIDAFFIEEDEIVLLDYKTDVVSSEKELADRYREQLNLYQKALEGNLGKNVKQKLIYSFYYDKTIEV